MQIRACCKSFEVQDKYPELVHIQIGLAAPGGVFIPVMAAVDSGCSPGIAIPRAMVEELGLKLPAIAQGVSPTAGGHTPMTESVADVKIICASGKPIVFRDVTISIDESLDEILLGLGLLKYFIFLLKDGTPSLEFNDRFFQ